MNTKLFGLLFQVSTLKGIIQAMVSAGIINLAPAVQDVAVHDILLIIGSGQAILSLINIVRDENKAKPKG